MSRVDAWVRPNLRGLKPYYKAPLEGNPLRLDQNTNLSGPNPALWSVDVDELNVTQYPTRDGEPLQQALAALHGLEPEQIVLGNGSDELLDILAKTFLGPGDVMRVPAPSYSLYPFYATLQDATLLEVPLTSKFQLSPEMLASQAKLTILANPNNPTGNRFRDEDVEALLAQDGVVVVDEAYIEYGGTSWLRRLDEFDNLVVMRTFSKAYGLAGLRIGWLAASKPLAAKLLLTKPPFNLNLFSEQVAIAALGETKWLADHVATVQEERERMAAGLKARGFRVHPSDANFLLTDPPLDAGLIQSGLQAQGILVRTFAGKPRLDGKVRFGIGEPNHTDQLLAALDEVLA
ncbi:MAG: histidinol-phosphate transaminase [Thermoplasmatota archaeon]